VLNRDHWKINFFDIDFIVPKKNFRSANDDEGASEVALPTENYRGRWNIDEIAVGVISFL